MVNIRELSKITNYSISTISKAFSNSTDISADTRKTILETAKKLGYEFKNTRKRSKGKILVLTKNVDSSDVEQFAYEVVFGFSAATSVQGYTVVCEKDDGTLSYEQRINQGDYIAGFILGYNQEDLTNLALYSSKVPTVILDNVINNDRIAYIGSDNDRGMFMAVEHLKKLGHKNIGLICGNQDSYVAQQRKYAFSLAMKQAKLALPQDLSVFSNFYANEVKEHVDHFVESGVSAIVCGSDQIAAWVIDELKTKNIRVPQDISIVGYDNAPLATAYDVSLTTIDQNGGEIGKAASMLLFQVIDGATISKFLLMPKLIVRDSTGPFKPKL